MNEGFKTEKRGRISIETDYILEEESQEKQLIVNTEEVDESDEQETDYSCRTFVRIEIR